MQPRELFNWTEICRCTVASDEEDMYDDEEDELRAPGSQSRRLKSHEKHKVMATFDSEEQDSWRR